MFEIKGCQVLGMVEVDAKQWKESVLPFMSVSE